MSGLCAGLGWTATPGARAFRAEPADLQGVRRTTGPVLGHCEGLPRGGEACLWSKLPELMPRSPLSHSKGALPVMNFEF